MSIRISHLGIPLYNSNGRKRARVAVTAPLDVAARRRRRHRDRRRRSRRRRRGRGRNRSGNRFEGLPTTGRLFVFFFFFLSSARTPGNLLITSRGQRWNRFYHLAQPVFCFVLVGCFAGLARSRNRSSTRHGLPSVRFAFCRLPVSFFFALKKHSRLGIVIIIIIDIVILLLLYRCRSDRRRRWRCAVVARNGIVFVVEIFFFIILSF